MSMSSSPPPRDPYFKDRHFCTFLGFLSVCSTGMTGEGVMGVTGEDEIMSWTVETLLDRYTQKTSPIVRQTACVWLLSLVRHTSGHPVFQVCSLFV